MRRELEDLRARVAELERMVLQLLSGGGTGSSNQRIQFCETIGEHAAGATQPVLLLYAQTPSDTMGNQDIKPQAFNMVQDVDIPDATQCLAAKLRADAEAWVIFQIATCG